MKLYRAHTDGVGKAALGAAAALLLAVLSGTMAQPAHAGDPFEKLRSNLVQQRLVAKRLASGSYETVGGDSFVLDLDSDPPRIRYEGDPEIYVLKSVPGPRGDVIYKLENGRRALNKAAIGGMTVYSQDGFSGGGAAASFRGDAPPLSLSPVDQEAIADILRIASEAASAEVATHIRFELMGFDAVELAPEHRAVVADAAVLAAKGIRQVASEPIGARAISERLRVVGIAQGESPGAALVEERLVVTVAPDKGVLGRPSSIAVRRALETQL